MLRSRIGIAAALFALSLSSMSTGALAFGPGAAAPHGALADTGLAVTLNWRLPLGGGTEAAFDRPARASFGLTMSTRQRLVATGAGIRVHTLAAPLADFRFSHDRILGARIAGVDTRAAENGKVSPWVYALGLAIAGGLAYIIVDIKSTDEEEDEQFEGGTGG